MLNAFLVALPIALGTVLATLPLVTIPLILATRDDQSAHVAFLAGWVAGIMGLGAVVMALSDLSTPDAAAPAAWVVWLRLALGVGLIGLALRKWIRRGDDGGDEPPRWMRTLETIPPGPLFGIGVVLVVANPKNALLVASGALTIAAATYAPAAQAGALAGFAIVASFGIGSPLLLTLTFGDRADQWLVAMKSTMTRLGKKIVAVVLLILGLIVVVNAVGDL